MSSHPSSLAFASAGWCVRALEPATPASEVARRLEALEGASLARCSRAAVREAALELLAALASEASPEWLGKVTPALTEEAALPALDNLLGGNIEDRISLMETDAAEDRAVVVAARLVIWLRARASGVPGPQDLDRLLAFGWLETGDPPRSVTFYQAYCRGLQREVLSHTVPLTPVLLPMKVTPRDWARWLASEAGLPPDEPRKFLELLRWHPPTVAAVTAAVIALVAFLAWHSRGQHEAGKTSQASTPAPIATPPVVDPGGNAPVAQATPAPVIPPEAPAFTPPRDPVDRAHLLMDDAEKALAENRHDDGDAAARTAQEILEEVMTTRNARIGDELSRVGIYWDTRERWTEAVRVHERAVKCYEKTPAENSAPQLDAVNRWASALRQVGRFTEAERLYRTLLQAYEGTGPALEVDAATVAHNLANVLVNSGRRKEARIFYEKALILMATHWSSDEEASKLAGTMGQNYQRCLISLGFTEDLALSETRRMLRLPRETKPPTNRTPSG
jgi:tetratricopeptide (TPR) repeat protein